MKPLPCLDPWQKQPPDGGNKAPGALKIMWFISHNATEIVDFRFNDRGPPGVGARYLSQKVKLWILLLGFQLQRSNDRAETFAIAPEHRRHLYGDGVIAVTVQTVVVAGKL